MELTPSTDPIYLVDSNEAEQGTDLRPVVPVSH
jgi:hypothetical protein